MLVDNVSWRSRVGCFNSCKRINLQHKCKFKLLNLSFLFFLKIPQLYIFLLVLFEIHTKNIFFNKAKHFFLLTTYVVGLSLWCGYYCGYVTLVNYFVQWVYFLLILRSGDVHKNPGPSNLISIMHWNLNSLLAHNGIRIPLIESYNILHKYDIIAITESALNDTASNDDIEIEGYIPIRKNLQPGITHGEFFYIIKNP